MEKVYLTSKGGEFTVRIGNKKRSFCSLSLALLYIRQERSRGENG